MDKLLTVIVQTSPLPSHPSTALIEALFRSFDRVTYLKDCSIVILCDGCDDEEGGTTKEADESGANSVNYKHGSVTETAAANYRSHLRELEGLVESETPPFAPSNGGSVRLLRLPRRHGSAAAIAAAFEILRVSTPYVMVCQHDNFFVRDVDYLRPILRYMDGEDTKSWLRCVHFPSTATLNYVRKVKRRYGLDLDRLCVREGSSDVDGDAFVGGQFVPLAFWYGRTHIARTKYYTEKILSEFPLKVGDHLEEIWGTRQLGEIVGLLKSCKCSENGEDEFDELFRELHSGYGNYVFFDYANDGELRKTEVLYHFSGRKARAAVDVSTNNDVSHNVDFKQTDNSSGASTFNPMEKSFTTARRAMALVPGLDFAPSDVTSNETKDNDAGRRAKPKFRQRCFHCGEKGHSFKFCPDNNQGMSSEPSMDILDLS